mgnify:CR=1 FL=1
MSLVYFNCDTNLTTKERSYAIRWLKKKDIQYLFTETLL